MEGLRIARCEMGAPGGSASRWGLFETGERVEADRLDMSQFRNLVFQNAVDLSCDPSCDFCKGSVLEGQEW